MIVASCFREGGFDGEGGRGVAGRGGGGEGGGLVAIAPSVI